MLHEVNTKLISKERKVIDIAIDGLNKIRVLLIYMPSLKGQAKIVMWVFVFRNLA